MQNAEMIRIGAENAPILTALLLVSNNWSLTSTYALENDRDIGSVGAGGNEGLPAQETHPIG
jgi:hypothetical protein